MGKKWRIFTYRFYFLLYSVFFKDVISYSSFSSQKNSAESAESPDVPCAHTPKVSRRPSSCCGGYICPSEDHWRFITPSPQITSGMTLGGVRSMSFNKYTVTCVHHSSSIEKCGFHCPKNPLHFIYLSCPPPQPLIITNLFTLSMVFTWVF